MLESLGFVMEFGAGQNGHSDNSLESLVQFYLGL